MKRLCVLEQSGTLHDPYTSGKKRLFQTDHTDFFRLNWRHREDPDATVTAPGVLWSEGRSILFESVPKTYDYYMFMDDDIHFHYSMQKKLDTAIIDLLEEYQPISATFYCEKLWGKNPITDKMRLQRRAYQFLCLDLQLTIYSRNFANIVFPVPFHGSDMCMWYAFWLANKINPGKQVCFSEISITNERSELHNSQAVRAFRFAQVKMFNRITKDKSFDWNVETCKQQNGLLFNRNPVKGPLEIDLSDVRRYCNWDSIYIKKRSPRRNLFHRIVVEPQQRWNSKGV